MRRKGLLVALWCFSGVVNSQNSAKPCAELASFSNRGGGSVCSASRLGPNGECLDIMPWAEAAEACASLGARLCTPQELANDVAAGTGCALDGARVWSSTAEGCPPSFAISLAGASRNLGSVGIECTPDRAALGVRCCADSFEAKAISPCTPCDSNPCNAGPNNENTCRAISLPGDLPGCPSSYRCLCAGPGQLATPGLDSCLDCSNMDPCVQKDPCRRADNPSNACENVYTEDTQPGQCPNGHMCTCAFPFLGPPDRQSCLFKCPNLCAQGDPCAVSDTGAGNTCTLAYLEGDDLGACPGSYVCTCKAPYSALVGQQGCQKCDDPCASDPCKTKDDNQNMCFPVSESEDSLCPTSHVCSCSGYLFVASPNQKQCEKCFDPCERDPCLSANNPENTCNYVHQDFDRCPVSHECSCLEFGFVAAENSKSCVQCPDPCAGDPCSSQGTANTCRVAWGPKDDVFNGCPSTYRCSCVYPSVADESRLQCESCDDPCVGDPCGTSENPENQCTVSFDPNAPAMQCPNNYRCQCSGFPWITTARQDRCQKCVDPCASDPCLSSFNDRNICTVLFSLDDDLSGCPSSHVCSCEGFGFVSIDDSAACSRCTDPCESDPCNNWADPNNKCIPLIPFGANMCATHRCECNYPRFTADIESTTCIACTDHCLQGDPCNTKAQLVSGRPNENTCQVARLPSDQPGQCPSTHICSCGAPFLITPDRQGCVECVSFCASDPCGTQGSGLNTCEDVYGIDPATGVNCPVRASCTCNGFGWVSTKNKMECKRCADPCAGNPCLTGSNNDNVCIPLVPPPGSNLCADHICQCPTEGFFPAEDNKSCKGCPNPCADDPCKHDENLENTCSLVYPDSGKCPVAVCDCAGASYAPANSNSSACEKCEDPCASDPCLTENTGNTCDNFGWTPATRGESQCNIYACVCKAPGFVSLDFGKKCAPCVNACNSDYNVCSTQNNPRNECKEGPLLPGTAPLPIPGVEGLYSCTTYACDCKEPGWVTPVERHTCEACQNPCAQGDPCASEYDADNTCTVLGVIPEVSSSAAATAMVTNSTGRRLLQRPDLQRRDSMVTSDFGSLRPNSCPGYVCNCEGVGWRTTVGRQSCLPCANPCAQGDPCNRAASPGNICIPTAGANLRRQASNTEDDFERCRLFTCMCAEGFVASVDGKSCIPCPNPCSFSNDPCQTNITGNTCTPNNYIPPSAPGAPMFNMEELPDNVLAVCGGYTCACEAKGYLVPGNKLTCEVCPNPCEEQNDPCNTKGNPNNKCIPDYMVSRPSLADSSSCGSFTCSCSGENWYQPDGAKSCELCPKACVGDPCHSNLDPANSCKPIKKPITANSFDNSKLAKCETYQCRCRGEGWLTPVDRQSCDPCSNPCDEGGHERCASEVDSRNVCTSDKLIPVIPQGYDTETGIVSGRRLLQTQQQYNYYPTPPVASSASSGVSYVGAVYYPPQQPQANVSVEYVGAYYPLEQAQQPDFYPNKQLICGSYTCACGGEGWMAGPSKRSCQRCQNPCFANGRDPCKTKLDSRNKCIPDFNVYDEPYLVVGRRQYGGGDMYTGCGGYTCHCAESGWLQPADGQTCEACPNPCMNGDPCLRNTDSRNVCSPDRLIPGVGYSERQPMGSTSSYQPVSNQPSFNTVGRRLLNHLTAGAAGTGRCGGYQCFCSQGWITPRDGQTCQRCPNPCSGRDPCKNGRDPRNVCVPDFTAPSYRRQSGGYSNYAQGDFAQCGGYTCQCSGAGWVASPDQQTCEACPNPCIGRDPCAVNMDSRNYCIPNYEPGAQNRAPSRRQRPTDFDAARLFDGTGTQNQNRFGPQQRGGKPRTATGNQGGGRPRMVGVPLEEPLEGEEKEKRGGREASVRSGNGYREESEEASENESGAFPANYYFEPSSSARSKSDDDKEEVEAESRQFRGFGGTVGRVTGPSPMLSSSSLSSPVLSSTSPIGMGSSFPTLNSQSGFVISNQPFGDRHSTLPHTDMYNVGGFGEVGGGLLSPIGSSGLAGGGGGGTPSPLGRCGVYKCECDAPGWMSTANDQGCVRCPDPCLSNDDPCGVRTGVNNKCLRTSTPVQLGYDRNDPLRKCGSFTCECGAGFVAASNGKRCDPCPNPCIGRDPCGTQQHPGNRCIPDPVGQYTGQFETQFDGASSYNRVGRRLLSHLNDASHSYSVGGTCGGYVCQCAGPIEGWVTPVERRSCIPCNNPCKSSDPCSSRIDPRNVCVPTAEDSVYGGNGSMNGVGCGGYMCQCMAPGFIASQGGQGCRTCPNICQTQDPCNTRLDPNNVCSPYYGAAPQYPVNGMFPPQQPYMAWNGAAGVGRRQGPIGPQGVGMGVGMVAPFPAPYGGGYSNNMMGMSPYGGGGHYGYGNNYPPYNGYGGGGGGCGTHRCACDGAGFEPGPNGLSCVAAATVTVCDDPCVSDPCNTNLNPDNKCINMANVQCGYYECQCAAGWQSVQAVVTQGPHCQVSGADPVRAAMHSGGGPSEEADVMQEVQERMAKLGLLGPEAAMAANNGGMMGGAGAHGQMDRRVAMMRQQQQQMMAIGMQG